MLLTRANTLEPDILLPVIMRAQLLIISPEMHRAQGRLDRGAASYEVIFFVMT